MALLGDDDFGQPEDLLRLVLPFRELVGFFRVRLLVGVVIFLAVDEQHDVGVLFDGTGFAQVGELGPLVVALLHGTAELGQGEHRHLQFLGQCLQAAGDLGDFLHAVLAAVAPGALQQLEIVDHDHADIVLPLQPPGAGAERSNGQRRRVVDEQRQRGKVARGARQLGKLILPDLALAQVLAVHARLFGQHAGGQLVGRHFQAEEGDRGAGTLVQLLARLPVAQVAHGAGEGDVGGQRGLAHGRAPGKDDEVGLVQPAHLGVQPIKAGGIAGQVAAGLHGPVGHLHGLARRLGESLDRAAHLALLGHAVEGLFRLLDLLQRLHFLRGVGGGRGHVAPHPNQLAQQRQVIDLAGEVAGGEQAGAVLGQLGQIGGAAHFGHGRVAVEQRLHGDGVGRHALVHQHQDTLVDAAVQRFGEMLRPQPAHHVLDQPVVDHQRAQQRGFGLKVLRQGHALFVRAHDTQGGEGGCRHGPLVAHARPGINIGLWIPL